MSLEIFTITKRINNGLFIFKAENQLFGFKSPKIQFTIIQPSNDNSGKYDYEKAFLDIPEIFKLIRNIQYYNPQNPNADVILKSFKGNFDKKRNIIVSRVFNVIRTNQQGKPPYVKFSIELTEGEQSYVKNKYGKNIPGVVKPKRGGHILNKGSIALNRDEALYVSSILEKEMQAWRTALNIDYMNNPQKYVAYNNNNQQNQPYPVPQNVQPNSNQSQQSISSYPPIPPNYQ